MSYAGRIRGTYRNRPRPIGRKKVWSPTEKKVTTKVEGQVFPPNIKVSRETSVTKKKLPWRMRA